MEDIFNKWRQEHMIFTVRLKRYDVFAFEVRIILTPKMTI